ncbi:MAG: nucleotide exchange factor GrpE [Planctomycetota bacterium]
MSLDPLERQRLLERIGEWLDRHAGEGFPVGLDPALAENDEAPADLATVIAALTALRHDARLQTKAFRRVDERLESMLTALEAARDEVVRSAKARVDAAEAALLELFDRMRRCQLAGASMTANLPWLSSRARVERLGAGLREGLDLTVERTRELLAEFGLRLFDPTGELFDPARMRAVGTRECDQGQDGRVAETLRVGIVHQHDGSVARAAEVLVGRCARLARGENS